MAFEHQPGMEIECLSIPIKLTKDFFFDSDGHKVFKCGFKVGGGIDQDFRKSPQGYKDSGIYVTEVYENSPAAKCGLKVHDKILQQHGVGQDVTCAFASAGRISVSPDGGDTFLACKTIVVNGYDFTMVTHNKAVEYIKKNPVLNMLVARKGVTHS